MGRRVVGVEVGIVDAGHWGGASREGKQATCCLFETGTQPVSMCTPSQMAVWKGRLTHFQFAETRGCESSRRSRRCAGESGAAQARGIAFVRAVAAYRRTSNVNGVARTTVTCFDLRKTGVVEYEFGIDGEREREGVAPLLGYAVLRNTEGGGVRRRKRKRDMYYIIAVKGVSRLC